MKTVIFIDGENFIHKIEDVLEESGVEQKKINQSKIKLKQLLEKVLAPQKIDQVVFYAAKLHFYPETAQRSQLLINRQRSLKAELEKQKITFIIAGNVRAQVVTGGKTVFKEKGVDVKMAIDMVTQACDHKLKTAVICSSDSDLQPAVYELKKRKVETIYLGFETSPNKGLTATTDKSILFRNAEILEAFRES
ncbi:MAG: NYN domain-containing protein [Patescibacteria group bacterium]|nr:NYN domain-containing protein [Patescibacteria group bacterium]MCL5431718.1 NYN domain-containing protein [Patescibacteria group bacterium]